MLETLLGKVLGWIDALPPTMLEVVEVEAHTKREANRDVQEGDVMKPSSA